MALSIHFQGGPQAGNRVTFEDDVERIVLGRDPAKCQVVFPPDETKVGREHCELVRKAGRYRLVMNKDNLVLVDRRPAMDGQELGVSADLQLGGIKGPQLVIQTLNAGELPSSHIEQRVPGKVTQIREAGSRSRIANRCALVALTLVLSLAGAGWFMHEITKTRLDGIEVETATQKSMLVALWLKSSDLKIGIESVRQDVSKLAPELADKLEEARASVYVVLVRNENGEEKGIGTAWVYDQQRGILATNAHVAAVFEKLGEGFQLVVRSNAEEPDDFVVAGARVHPSYAEFSELWNEYQPVRKTPFATMEHVQSAGSACDVAWLLITDPQRLAPALPLADAADLETLRPGSPVGYAGYPMEYLRGTNLLRPTPTTHQAYVTAVTSYFGESHVPIEERLLIQNALPAAGGASGSPILNGQGKVVAVLSGGNVIAAVDEVRIISSVQINFAQRADLLKELEPDYGNPPERKSQWQQKVEQFYVAAAEASPAVASGDDPQPVAGNVRREELVNIWLKYLASQHGIHAIEEEMTSKVGELRQQDESVIAYVHNVVLPESGYYLVVAVAHQDDDVDLLVARSHGDELEELARDDRIDALAYGQFQLDRPGPVQVLVVGPRVGAEFDLHVYRAVVDGRR